MPGRRGQDMTAVLSPPMFCNFLKLNGVNNHGAGVGGREGTHDNTMRTTQNPNQPKKTKKQTNKKKNTTKI